MLFKNNKLAVSEDGVKSHLNYQKRFYFIKTLVALKDRLIISSY